MDSEDPIALTFVHDVDGTESAVDETTPHDTVFPGVGVALGDSAAPQDLVLPPSRAARLSTEPSGKLGTARLLHDSWGVALRILDRVGRGGARCCGDRGWD